MPIADEFLKFVQFVFRYSNPHRACVDVEAKLSTKVRTPGLEELIEGQAALSECWGWATQQKVKTFDAGIHAFVHVYA